MAITRKDLQRFVNLTAAARYDYFNKEEYRKLGRRILKEIANLIGLQKGNYDIRWNPGGVACSGDHTLHADWFYLALHDNTSSGWFYFRTCKGRKDYTGGHNQIVNWTWLIENGVLKLATRICEDCNPPEPDEPVTGCQHTPKPEPIRCYMAAPVTRVHASGDFIRPNWRDSIAQRQAKTGGFGA